MEKKQSLSCYLQSFVTLLTEKIGNILCVSSRWIPFHSKPLQIFLFLSTRMAHGTDTNGHIFVSY